MKIIENRTGLIYCWKYKDGRCYVGQTFEDNEGHRKKRHLTYSKQHKRHDEFHDLLNDHIEDFEYTVLERGIPTPFIYEKNTYDKSQLNEREKYWTAVYDSFINGFNTTPGGDAGYSENYSSRLGIKDEKLSERMKGNTYCLGKHWTLSEETKQKMRKPKSEDTKKKMGAWQKGKPKSEKARHNILIAQRKRRQREKEEKEVINN